MTLKLKVLVENQDDLDDLEHYASCGYHSQFLLGMVHDAAEHAKRRLNGKFPLGIQLDAGNFRPGMETESEMGEQGSDDETEEMPFVPRRQSPASA